MYLHPYMCALIQFLIFVLVISSYLSNIKILTYQLGQEKKIAVWLLIYLTSLLAERERRRWRQLSILIVWNLYNCRRRISNEKKLSAVWGHYWHHNYKLSGFVPKLKPSSSYRSKSNLVWRLKSLFLFTLFVGAFFSAEFIGGAKDGCEEFLLTVGEITYCMLPFSSESICSGGACIFKL